MINLNAYRIIRYGITYVRTVKGPDQTLQMRSPVWDSLRRCDRIWYKILSWIVNSVHLVILQSYSSQVTPLFFELSLNTAVQNNVM